MNWRGGREGREGGGGGVVIPSEAWAEVGRDGFEQGTAELVRVKGSP